MSPSTPPFDALERRALFRLGLVIMAGLLGAALMLGIGSVRAAIVAYVFSALVVLASAGLAISDGWRIGRAYLVALALLLATPAMLLETHMIGRRGPGGGTLTTMGLLLLAGFACAGISALMTYLGGRTARAAPRLRPFTDAALWGVAGLILLALVGGAVSALFGLTNTSASALPQAFIGSLPGAAMGAAAGLIAWLVERPQDART